MINMSLKSLFFKSDAPTESVEQKEVEGFLKGIPDALIMYDAGFRVLYFNSVAEILFKLPSESVVGHILSPRDASEAGWQILTQTIFSSLAPRLIQISKEGEFPERYDLSFTDPDIELRVTTIPIKDDKGANSIFFKIIQDRTMLISALRSKSEFVTVASHQFRGPMTDISWALQTLADDKGLSDTSKLIVENALAASKGLIDRIEDLLSVAKMEDGQVGYAFADTDIVDFIGTVLAGILPSAQKTGIKMYFDRPKDALPHVSIDTKRLSIALTNFLENAVKYNIENGEVIVSVDQVPGKPFIEISVKDTGIGVPPESMDKLFKKFYRAENAVASQTEGSGLGLYMAKGIINAHGGEVWAESEVGRGTIMHFTLPTDPNLIPKHEPGLQGFLI